MTKTDLAKALAASEGTSHEPLISELRRLVQAAKDAPLMMKADALERCVDTFLSILTHTVARADRHDREIDALRDKLAVANAKLASLDTMSGAL